MILGVDAHGVAALGGQARGGCADATTGAGDDDGLVPTQSCLPPLCRLTRSCERSNVDSAITFFRARRSESFHSD